MIFLNLTNGLEHLPKFPNAQFIRIQSTWCEQKHWSKLIEDLDYNFLLALARGKSCIIIDCSQKGNARAMFQGIEFIRFILHKYWFNKKLEVFVRGNNATDYFDSVKLSRSAERKLKYFRKFLLTNSIQMLSLSYKTTHDGDYDFYRETLRGQKVKERHTGWS